ncbi:MAG: DUF3054 domain-containing protein [Anaerolineae bacterium]|jgi:hypothetical protein|nr:DUF3054 domain-containing protein [Anaerolineae bacterium]MBT7073916.1 DUF3054 domain-containing protein [Anaerolineae bacterium]MBT7783194.1 DUF3054 domain-containing protein [Anaerolineae bacterium]
MKKKIHFLLLGDILTVLIVTVSGFLFHDQLSTVSPYRILATLLPTLIAWLLIAPWLGLYKEEIYQNWKEIWRAGWAVILAAPFAALLRSLMLGNTPILPVFIAVLAATAALGMLIWRGVWWAILEKQKR